MFTGSAGKRNALFLSVPRGALSGSSEEKFSLAMLGKQKSAPGRKFLNLYAIYMLMGWGYNLDMQ